jgi:hypothetical protein
MHCIFDILEEHRRWAKQSRKDRAYLGEGLSLCEEIQELRDDLHSNLNPHHPAGVLTDIKGGAKGV